MKKVIALMRSYLNKPLYMVLLFVCTLLSAAVLFSIFEGKPIVDALWWAIVTSSTVGFGDIFPTSIVGRFVAGASLMFLSNFLITPLITAKMAAELIVNSDAFTHEEQEELKALLRNAVAGEEASAKRESETQALLRETASLIERNNFTTEEQAEVIGLLRQVVPLLRLVQSQTDEVEGLLKHIADENDEAQTPT